MTTFYKAEPVEADPSRLVADLAAPLGGIDSTLSPACMTTCSAMPEGGKPINDYIPVMEKELWFAVRTERANCCRLLRASNNGASMLSLRIDYSMNTS